MTNRLEEYVELMEAAVEETTKQHRKAMQSYFFKTIVEPFLVRRPEITGVTWTQYTPHWNDGEECTFEVNAIRVMFDDLELEDHGEYEEDIWIDLDTTDTQKKIDELRGALEGKPLDFEKWRFSCYRRKDHAYVSWSYRDAAHHDHEIDLGRVREALSYHEGRLESFLDQEKKFGPIKGEISRDVGLLRREIKDLGDEIMEGVFGDHVKVTCTREGINVLEYDHE